MINTLKRGMPNRLYHKILLIMRLTTVILIASLMQVSAAGLAQRVTMNQKNTSLENVLKALRQQTGYNVLYDVNLINKARPVNLNLKDAAVEEAMTQILKGQALEYKIEERNIIIKPKEPSFLDRASSVIQSLSKDLFQSIDVRGIIRDEQGNPMPNATIVVKDKSQVYRSNNKGEFNIPNVGDDAVLVISYVGYQRLEINVKNAVMPLEIKLNMATGELEEVNIQYSTGYQDIPKERATGSFVQIDNELVNRSVSTNIIDRLVGVASSVNFNPGPAPTGQYNRAPITVRGNSTINASSNPLIVVDGFPYDESAGFQNVINNLNPNDVESVTILRDAAAASIWGARAGNGVIVITTKKGRFGQPTKIAFNSNINIGEKSDLFYLERISSVDAVAVERKRFASGEFNLYDDLYPSLNVFPSVSPVAEILLAMRRGNISNIEAEARLKVLENQDVRNDISKYLQQKSINQQYQFNLSGGTNQFNYYGSVGYDKNRSNTVGNGYSRLTIRYDNSYRPVKNLELNGFINYTQGKTDANGIELELVTGTAPYTMLADASGNSLATFNSSGIRAAYIDTARYPGLKDWHYRPLEELNLNDNTHKEMDNRFGFGAKYLILPRLNVQVKYQYQKLIGMARRYYSPESFLARDLFNKFVQRSSSGVLSYPIPQGGILDQNYNSLVGNNLRGQLNYDGKWGMDHAINALVGAEAREVISESSNSNRKYGYDIQNGTFVSNIDFATRFTVRPSGTQSIQDPASIGGTINRYISYFANAAYTYKKKYTLTASARADGSNFFGIKPNQKITPLWSVGAMWDIFKESFYKVTWLSSLKLRATYGYNGNMYNTVTAYPTIRYTGGSSNYPSLLSYASVSTPGNPNLKWENVAMANIALDFASRENRINGSIEFYHKKGIDLIGQILTDPTIGFSSFTGNRASICGKGVDLTLNTINTTGQVNWQTNLLFSYNKDKVTAYELSGATDRASTHLTQPNVGQPLYSLRSYRFAGLNPLNGDPRYYVADTIASFATTNQSAKPTDLVFHGSATPVHFGAIRNSFSYKQVSLSFNITYKFDYYIRRSSINYTNLTSSWSGHSDYAMRWQKTGDESITNVPSFPATLNSTRDIIYNSYTDILVEKGDHIRLQDIRLSYDLNKSIVKSLPVQNISLFMYANNLGILWRANKHKIDPDFGDATIPPSRTMAFGLNVNF